MAFFRAVLAGILALSMNFAHSQGAPIKICGLYATDMSGYLRIDPPFYNALTLCYDLWRSIKDGQGNPLDRIPKRPGAIYPRANPIQEQFNLPDGFVDQWERLKPKQ